MHPYQRHIIQQLTFSGLLRYSDLKPPEATSNRFVYHLQRLMKDGYIEKKGGRYGLTKLGKRYIDSLSMHNFAFRAQPKIVTVIICKNREGKYLVFRRNRQPFLGFLNFPYGKIHLGETIKEAAARELREKTGLRATLVHVGDAYLTVERSDDALIPMFCHIFLGSHPTGTLESKVPTGTSSWEDLKAIDREKFIPGFLDLYLLAQKSKHKFFAELRESDNKR